jgi:hypothetical protein
VEGRKKSVCMRADELGRKSGQFRNAIIRSRPLTFGYPRPLQPVPALLPTPNLFF